MASWHFELKASLLGKVVYWLYSCSTNGAYEYRDNSIVNYYRYQRTGVSFSQTLRYTECFIESY